MDEMKDCLGVRGPASFRELTDLKEKHVAFVESMLCVR